MGGVTYLVCRIRSQCNSGPLTTRGITLASDQDFQPRLGTALATFTQRGTFSGLTQVSGRLVGLYSDNYPTAAGSVDFYSAYAPTGTGYPVQTWDGTVMKLAAFGAGTFYSLGATPMLTQPLGYVGLRIGTAGTAGVAAGGTIVLVTEQR